MTYEIGIRLRMAKLLPPVQELEESVNGHLAEMNVNQKLVITSVLPLVLKVKRQPSKEEMEQMKRIIVDEFNKSSFGPVSIEYVRRQSGNVRQSVSSAS